MNLELLQRVAVDCAIWTGLDVDRMQKLVGILGALILDRRTGGLEGFVSRFQRAGLDHVIHSWLASGPNGRVTPIQVEQALGPSAIKEIARSLGWSREVACRAISQVLPDVVDQLTRDGEPQPDLLPSLRQWEGLAVSNDRPQRQRLHEAGKIGLLFLVALMVIVFVHLNSGVRDL